MSTGQTSNLFLIYLTVDGETIPGAWDKKTGGGVAAEEQKYRPGGSSTQVTLGAAVNVENVTLSRLFIRERDHDLVKRLFSRVGKAMCVVTQQPLDSDYNPWGTPTTWTGRLNKCTPPETDSNSQSPSMVELEISTQGMPA